MHYLHPLTTGGLQSWYLGDKSTRPPENSSSSSTCSGPWLCSWFSEVQISGSCLPSAQTDMYYFDVFQRCTNQEKGNNNLSLHSDEMDGLWKRSSVLGGFLSVISSWLVIKSLGCNRERVQRRSEKGPAHTKFEQLRSQPKPNFTARSSFYV